HSTPTSRSCNSPSAVSAPETPSTTRSAFNTKQPKLPRSSGATSLLTPTRSSSPKPSPSTFPPANTSRYGARNPSPPSPPPTTAASITGPATSSNPHRPTRKKTKTKPHPSPPTTSLP